jgi:hypothetical protein
LGRYHDDVTNHRMAVEDDEGMLEQRAASDRTERFGLLGP